MVDCVRAEYDIKHGSLVRGKILRTLRGTTKDICSQECIISINPDSSQECNGYNYSSDGTCLLLNIPDGRLRYTPITGSITGRVKCHPERNYVMGCVWVLVGVTVILLLWYLLNPKR